ncbi:hypothetical protein NQX30_00245 [Candidatus Persebacteraceae bacterium Df01]|jgi:SAM-dependent methyltransferase|uniref:Methyltransferase domain-containing protein n=1 Tax=Candidatus Doriopsillibacter californiensis TaxID=2970740 RepID=A0ABT7QJI1_9GAMM|nr:hypothetical protein [Candidatus Persebacteraceae bacterium Df01]
MGEAGACKAQLLNDIIRRHQVSSIIDFGCGDGNQIAKLADIDYLGFDMGGLALTLFRQRNQIFHLCFCFTPAVGLSPVSDISRSNKRD